MFMEVYGNDGSLFVNFKFDLKNVVIVKHFQ